MGDAVSGEIRNRYLSSLAPVFIHSVFGLTDPGPAHVSTGRRPIFRVRIRYPVIALAGYYALRGFCYTPNPLVVSLGSTTCIRHIPQVLSTRSLSSAVAGPFYLTRYPCG